MSERKRLLNKKALVAVAAIVAVVIIGTVVAYVLIANDEPFSGTVVFQSNVAGVTATMVGPDGVVRTGIIGDTGELAFSDLPEGDYWYVCAKDGYGTSCGSGTLDREIEGGVRTFYLNMEIYPAHMPLYSTANPSAVAIEQGSSGTVTVTVASLLDITGEGTMGCAQLPYGVSASYSPPTITLTAGGKASSDLTLTVGSTVPKGSYLVEISCSTEQLIHVHLALLLHVH